MNTTRTGNLTTIQLLESFWNIHWASYSPSHRTKMRGRLVVMAASLLDDPADGTRIVRRLREQNVKNGVRRPEAGSPDSLVARYLLDYFLPAPDYLRDTTAQRESPELVQAAAWVNAHSKPAIDITREDLVKLRADLGGQTYHTRRTYWATIETVIRWALLVGQLERDPSIGIPKLRRDLHADRVDTNRVLTESEVWKLAHAGDELLGAWFATAVLLGSFGALRVGELVALRRRNVHNTKDGALWLTIDTQHRRFSKRSSNDGHSTSDFAPTKGRTSTTAARRHCYIPSRVAREIQGYIDSRLPEELLFLNTRGTPFSATTFRTAWKRVLETEPLGHRLAGITPHAMRRAGMSMWLRQGVDLKLIQRWGGWHSLKVMLDTYAALLPDAEQNAVVLLEDHERKRSLGSP